MNSPEKACPSPQPLKTIPTPSRVRSTPSKTETAAAAVTAVEGEVAGGPPPPCAVSPAGADAVAAHPVLSEVATPQTASPPAEASAPASAENCPQLEPSLSAWFASRKTDVVAPNVGASEREGSTQAPRRGRSRQRSRGQAQLSTFGPTGGEAYLSVPLRRPHQESKEEGDTSNSSALIAPWNREDSCESDSDRSHRSLPWQRSLRGPDYKQSAGGSGAASTWRPELTVARGPQLATAGRARSRSRSSSAPATPGGSPHRRVLANGSLVGSAQRTPREVVAEQGHSARMAQGRRLSTSPMPRHLQMDYQEDAHLRSQRSQSRSHSVGSISSRLSQLSRPRSLSRPQLTSEELERRDIDLSRQRVKDLLLANQRSLPQTLAPPEPLHPSERHLTVPRELRLHTEQRAARSRSSSVQSQSLEHLSTPILHHNQHRSDRERLAAEKHMERMTTAQVLTRAKAALDRGLDSEPLTKQLEVGLASKEQERWIREAPDMEERAQRARVVAKAVRSEAERWERENLCIFNAPGQDPLDGDVDAVDEGELSS
mmetsp:Transcript_88773/g.194540  ORF Transcript_88773/g.194540 Transcript_88773/m.194540 type:complete len:544 (-) Transcript_88773:230-1861(-)